MKDGAEDERIANFVRDVPDEVASEEDVEYVLEALRSRPRTLKVLLLKAGILPKLLENMTGFTSDIFMRYPDILAALLDVAPAGSADSILYKGKPLIVLAAKTASFTAAKVLLDHGANPLPGRWVPSTLIPRTPWTYGNSRLYDLLAAAEDATGRNPERAAANERLLAAEKARAEAEWERKQAEAEWKRANALTYAERAAKAEADAEAWAEAKRREHSAKYGGGWRGHSWYGGRDQSTAIPERRISPLVVETGPAPERCASWGKVPQGPPGGKYRPQALLYHPDKNSNPQCTATANKKFLELQRLFGK